MECFDAEQSRGTQMSLFIGFLGHSGIRASHDRSGKCSVYMCIHTATSFQLNEIVNHELRPALFLYRCPARIGQFVWKQFVPPENIIALHIDKLDPLRGTIDTVLLHSHPVDFEFTPRMEFASRPLDESAV